jgi:hypothetical protein
MKSMLVGVGMVMAAASLGLVSCGSDAATPADSVIDVGPTNFVTIPPTPVTIPTVTSAPNTPGSIIEFESEYTVVDGDYPSTVANKFHVNLQEFMTLNNFTLVGTGSSAYVPEWTGAGQVVKIPPGAIVPGEPPPTAPTTAAPGGGSPTDTTPVDTTPAATDPPASATTTTTSDCTPGSYTITADDTSRDKVAKKFDVTTAALDAANANTKYYKSFAPGVKIVIPC